MVAWSSGEPPHSLELTVGAEELTDAVGVGATGEEQAAGRATRTSTLRTHRVTPEMCREQRGLSLVDLPTFGGEPPTLGFGAGPTTDVFQGARGSGVPSLMRCWIRPSELSSRTTNQR